jgi:hypothetical protein
VLVSFDNGRRVTVAPAGYSCRNDGGSGGVLRHGGSGSGLVSVAAVLQ